MTTIALGARTPHTIRRRWVRFAALALLMGVALTLVLALVSPAFRFNVEQLAVQATGGGEYQVSGASMEPALHNGELLLVQPLSAAPYRGEIVIFHPPTDPARDYVKRIIGLPGETVYITLTGMVEINGHLLVEPYAVPGDNPMGRMTVYLKPGQYFMMGDNRGSSLDSREFGPVEYSSIIGQVTAALP